MSSKKLSGVKQQKLEGASEDIAALEVTEGTKIKQKSRRFGRFLLGVGLVVVIIGGVFGVIKWKLGGVRVEISTADESEVAAVRVNYLGKAEGSVLEEFCRYNLLAQDLLGGGFRELNAVEIAEGLNELKEGFSQVLKTATELDRTTDFAAVQEIILNDTANFLTEIRSLRQVMARTYENEADQQMDFLKVVSEENAEMRSAVYVSRYAFEGDETRIVRRSAVLAQGKLLVEVGGGVMNIMVGDYKQGVVGLSDEDYQENIKTLAGEDEFILLTTGELVRIGESVKGELVSGQATMLKVQEVTECENKKQRGEKCKEITVERTKVGLFGRSVFEVAELLEARGGGGLLKRADLSGGRQALKEAAGQIAK